MEIRLAYYKSTSSSWFIAKEKLLNHWLEKNDIIQKKIHDDGKHGKLLTN